MMKPLGSYDNGNYTVTIYPDGTKIRQNDLDHFSADFPESIDLKITNQCNLGCPMCHERSTPDGEHADLLSLSFLDHMHPYTELAIGGGNPLAHPDLVSFLRRMKEQKVICNLTVNEAHLQQEHRNSYGFVHRLTHGKLIRGLGISISHVDPVFVDHWSHYDSAVFHVINGLFTFDLFKELSEATKGRAKVLILGYKNWGRGEDYLASKGGSLPDMVTREQLKQMIDEKWFKVISFDNLALSQIQVRDVIHSDLWNQIYMGDDGQHTMYVDMVKREFATNSTSADRKPLLPTIDEMFAEVKRSSHANRH